MSSRFFHQGRGTRRFRWLEEVDAIWSFQFGGRTARWRLTSPLHDPARQKVNSMLMNRSSRATPSRADPPPAGPCGRPWPCPGQVELLHENPKIHGDHVNGNDDVLVDLETRGALGNGRELVAVLPEEFRLLVVAWPRTRPRCQRARRCPGHALHHGLGPGRSIVVRVHLDQEHGNGVALVPARTSSGSRWRVTYLMPELLQGAHLDQVAFHSRMQVRCSCHQDP